MNPLISAALYLFVATAGIQGAFHNRIVGGSRSDIRLSPYQVLLYLDDHLCGGSVINSKCILTAAHCTYGVEPSKMLIRGGVTDRTKEEGVSRLASQSFIPVEYDTVTNHMDVAIIRLASPIEGDNIRSIPLASSDAPAGTTLRVTGWGKTSEDGKTSAVLKQTFVQAISDKDCRTKYEGYAISDAMFCASVPGGVTDSCAGDSGGPVVAGGIQYGIVSWGVGCARPDHPGVYTKVAAARQWIDETVEKFCQ